MVLQGAFFHFCSHFFNQFFVYQELNEYLLLQEMSLKYSYYFSKKECVIGYFFDQVLSFGKVFFD